jgi:hypothetical protein
MSEKDKKSGMEITKQDNTFLDKFKGKRITKENLAVQVKNSKYYQCASDEEVALATDRIFDKLQKINAEYLQWFELLMSFAFACIGYSGPKLMLIFQKILRRLEMENEVMQFQTIILMLMKIERINVEMILEWIERYSNIFREPITKCVNNYEAGAWEALEELKNDIAFPKLIRIVESLQASVESIPIAEAFDEMDNERDYYKAKREESNNVLISRKGMIGKGIGFAPLVAMFVGYLIIPLVLIGLTSMTSSFTTMSTMM